MKTKICNNNYGHLKSCDLNYQSDYQLGHLNDDLKKLPLVIKLDMSVIVKGYKVVNKFFNFVTR